ncbi:hypothetical protein FRB96_002487 [Tulasnella sp. 330]|nr:hypothetical protein FRB96_002487 [Tulasnella sp. 330]
MLRDPLSKEFKLIELGADLEFFPREVTRLQIQNEYVKIYGKLKGDKRLNPLGRMTLGGMIELNGVTSGKTQFFFYLLIALFMEGENPALEYSERIHFVAWFAGKGSADAQIGDQGMTSVRLMWTLSDDEMYLFGTRLNMYPLDPETLTVVFMLYDPSARHYFQLDLLQVVRNLAEMKDPDYFEPHLFFAIPDRIAKPILTIASQHIAEMIHEALWGKVLPKPDDLAQDSSATEDEDILTLPLAGPYSFGVELKLKKGEESHMYAPKARNNPKIDALLYSEGTWTLFHATISSDHTVNAACLDNVWNKIQPKYSPQVIPPNFRWR